MFAAKVPFWTQAAAGGGFGNSVYFANNGNQFLSKSSVSQLITWKNTGGFTIEYWLYMNAFPVSINGGFGNQDGAGTNYWSFGPITSGALEFYHWAPGTNYFTTNTSVLTLNTWHAVAAVFTSVGATTTASMYIDGTRVNIRLNNAGAFASTATTTSGVYSTGTVFGGGKYGASILNGYIDNIRVSNVNRYSGASYTVATTGFTLDSNTYLLIPPVESNGATSIAFQSTGGNGTMTNATNLVTVSSSRANHT